MITVRFSKGQELVLPESLGRVLGLREGDRVEIRRLGKKLHIRRERRAFSPGPLTEISGIILARR
ncbi:MAG: AbrB/MazE/SpoVT family DNA-binding domain-containing protein [Anaerolineae bacterium]|nr:AbrB/MazE/SpoVT family DNA-binding domain-containing protein [Anaerolineae bacterium]